MRRVGIAPRSSHSSVVCIGSSACPGLYISFVVFNVGLGASVTKKYERKSGQDRMHGYRRQSWLFFGLDQGSSAVIRRVTARGAGELLFSRESGGSVASQTYKMQTRN